MQEQACMGRQDYAYIASYPENLETQNRAEPQNKNPNNLTCILSIQKHKPNLKKHIKTHCNKQNGKQKDLKAKNKRKEKEKFRLDTSHKSFPSLVLTVPLSQVYSETNKKVISNVKLKGLGPE